MRTSTRSVTGHEHGGHRLDLTRYTLADTVVPVQFFKNGTTGWHTIDLDGNPGSGFGQLNDHPGPDTGGLPKLAEPAQTEAIYVA